MSAKTMITPELLEQFMEREPQMAPGNWGVNERTFCMMSAVVNGAQSAADCVAAGWPAWFANLIPSLYDGHTPGNRAERRREANQWAFLVMLTASRPIDYERARAEVRTDLIELCGEPATFTRPAWRKNLDVIAMIGRMNLQPGKSKGDQRLSLALLGALRGGVLNQPKLEQAAEYLIEAAPDNDGIEATLFRLRVMEESRATKGTVTRRARKTVLRAMQQAAQGEPTAHTRRRRRNLREMFAPEATPPRAAIAA